MRTLLSIAIVIAGLTQGIAFADDIDPPAAGDNRIKLLAYDEAEVYTIITRYGYQTNIVFGPSEEIETISVGDRSVWQIIPAGNRLFIRPMDEDVTTNMTILTNKHSYQFDLKSMAADKSKGNIYVAKFVYNDEKKPPVVSAAMPPMSAAPPFGVAPSVTPVSSITPQLPAPISDMASPAHPNYNYTYSGSDDLAPLQVYDDGSSTYIKYRTKQALPSVFVIDATGHETPANYTTRDDYMVVNAVAGEMVLKNQYSVVHVFNENISPK